MNIYIYEYIDNVLGSASSQHRDPMDSTLRSLPPRPPGAAERQVSSESMISNGLGQSSVFNNSGGGFRPLSKYPSFTIVAYGNGCTLAHSYKYQAKFEWQLFKIKLQGCMKMFIASASVIMTPGRE